MRCYSKKLILLLLLIIVSLLVGCTFVDNFVGQAGRMTDNGKGTWLVVTLDQVKPGVFRFSKLDTQQYDKEKKEDFDRVLSRISPEDRGFNYQLIVRQGKKVQNEFFSSTTDKIIESRERIGLGEYVDDIGRNKIVVKISDVNLRPLEVSVRNLNDGKEKIILKGKDSIKFLRELNLKKSTRSNFKKRITKPKARVIRESNRITGRVIAEIDEDLCENLKGVIPGHNDVSNENRINLVFLGYGYPDKDVFVNSLSYYLDFSKEGLSFTDGGAEKTQHGLFYYEPFEENFIKFNFWYKDEIFTADEKYDDSSKSCGCVSKLEEKELINNCDLDNLKISIMCHDLCRSFAYSDYYLSLTSTKSEDPELDFYPYTQVFVHEFGHLFGDLRDEYVESGKMDRPKFPNCASDYGWAENWWYDLFPDLELFNGCSYAGNNVRFSFDSIMRESKGPEDFGDVNKFYLCYKIFQASGDVDGEFCDNLFDENFEPPEEICADGIDNDGDEKVDCADSECFGDVDSSGEDCKEICNNWGDEDQNGLTNCADPQCQNQYCDLMGQEDSAICVDCELDKEVCIEGCPQFIPKKICTDKKGLDEECTSNNECYNNNCDGTCVGDIIIPTVPIIQEEVSEQEDNCDDFIDNDGDGKIDCADEDCDMKFNALGYACCIEDHTCSELSMTDEYGECIHNVCLPGDINVCQEPSNQFCIVDTTYDRCVYLGDGLDFQEELKSLEYKCVTDMGWVVPSNIDDPDQYCVELGYHSVTEINNLNICVYDKNENKCDNDDDCMVNIESSGPDVSCKMISKIPIISEGEPCTLICIQKFNECSQDSEISYCKELNCWDNSDNNNDGMVDCDDQSCQGEAGAGICWENDCSDGEDNDNDQSSDCGDFDCLDKCKLLPEWQDKILLKQGTTPYKFSLDIYSSYIDGEDACASIGKECVLLEKSVYNNWFSMGAICKVPVEELAKFKPVRVSCE